MIMNFFFASLKLKNVKPKNDKCKYYMNNEYLMQNIEV
jgi:hypothetical protein